MQALLDAGSFRCRLFQIKALTDADYLQIHTILDLGSLILYIRHNFAM